MGKNNADKLRARLVEKDPNAAKRLNNLSLNNANIRNHVAMEVTGHYDLSRDLDAFDQAFRYGLDKEPNEYFEDLDTVQLGDLEVEGDDIMFIEDEEEICAYESLLESMIDEDEFSDEDFDFAEDMFTAVEAALADEDEFELPVIDNGAMEATVADELEEEEDAYEIMLEEEEDEDEDLNEIYGIDEEDDELLDPDMDDDL